MVTSGAKTHTKRAKKVLNDLLYIKENYVYYTIGHNEKEWKKAAELFAHIEDYIIELSSGKKVIEAQLAEKIKKNI